MKVAFYSPHACLRGTTVAIFDYCLYNQSILGNESVFIYHANDHRNHPTTIKRFQDNLKCTAIADFNQLDPTLSQEKADAVYIIKGGKNDGIVSRVCRNLIHCIALQNDPHGERYAYGSQWLSEHCSGGAIPFVPYTIAVPDYRGNLRGSLGIPEDSLVLGRTGGMDSWNIPWAIDAMRELIDTMPNLYLVLQNTPVFYQHPRIKHIESTADIQYKVHFLNSCDAMIHIRLEGESFGQACGEFSVRNKPVITYGLSPEKSHISILKDKGFYYKDKNELINLVRNFEKQPHIDWNCYREFEPPKVMQIFKRVFLD